MAIWSIIPLGVGIVAAFIAVVGHGRSSVTTLHIDH